MADVEVFDERVCDLGEGPVYDERTDRAYWVDIHGKRVLWRGVRDRTDAGEFDTAAHVGAAVPTYGGGFVLALPDRLVLRGSDGGERRIADYRSADAAAGAVPSGVLAPAADTPITRSNDAKADPAGRLWHGTMAYDFSPGAGALYRLDPGAPVTRRIISGLAISNGLGWSRDGTTMYHIDTPRRRVDAYDYDMATGVPTRRRTLVAFEDGAGDPDGMCVDAADGLWVGMWGGSAVRRYRPDGTLDRVVRVPASQVTSCAFAGPQLDLLVITTAVDGRDDDPTAGRTYAHRPGDVVGLPVDRFAE